MAVVTAATLVSLFLLIFFFFSAPPWEALATVASASPFVSHFPNPFSCFL